MPTGWLLSSWGRVGGWAGLGVPNRLILAVIGWRLYKPVVGGLLGTAGGLKTLGAEW